MSGIYTPILTIFTLIVLSFQVKLQSQLNTFTLGRNYIEDARSDIHFYLEQLVRESENKLSDDIDVRESIISYFAYISFAELQKSETIKMAGIINHKHQRLVSMWSAYYCVIAGLKQGDQYPYDVNYRTAKQKAIAMLSFEYCAALDNLMWAFYNGRVPCSYEFSDILPGFETSL